MEIDSDNDELFHAKDWIGRGDSGERARIQQIVKIPENFAKQCLPQSSLSVTELVSFKLPRVSSEFISTKVISWFSTDEPTIDYSILTTRPIPSREFLSKLNDAAGQAWLNGAKSIVDHRFNDGTDRLPLWTVTFWMEVARCEEICSHWKDGVSWLERQESKAKRKGNTLPETIKQACELLESLPWDQQMPYCNGMTSTAQLSKFLGTYWLSDDHINMMVEELCAEMESDVKLKDSKTKVANLAFTMEISKVHEKLAYSDSQKKKTLLWKYQKMVEEGTLDRLYFPLHINACHWIAAMIDFKRRTFLSGI